MLRRKTIALAFAAPLLALTTAPAHAFSVRVDSGDWFNSGFSNAGTTTGIGFDFSMLGVTADTAQINTNGSVVLSGGGQNIQLNPFLNDQTPSFFNSGATRGGNPPQVQFGTTLSTFADNTPGLDAGFRVEWVLRDSDNEPLNEFQMALFDLSNGQFALEFNYNALTVGDDDSQIGYSTNGDSVDLLADLGDLSFADYMGFGDDGFGLNPCDPALNILACNNYFANSGDFGPLGSVLPGTANGFFQQIDSNGDPVQGRYLWLFGDVTGIAEPSTLALIAFAIFGFAFSRRRLKV